MGKHSFRARRSHRRGQFSGSIRPIERLEPRLLLSSYVVTGAKTLTDSSTSNYGWTADSTGNLIGFASGPNYGRLVEIPASGTSIQTLAAFDYTTNGGYPDLHLYKDSSGNIYTTTYAGPAQPGEPYDVSGQVVEVPAGSNTINVIGRFNRGVSGHPVGPLTMDSDGNLYGLCWGEYDNGGIFEVPKGSGNITMLAEFSRHNPQAENLVRDAQGNFYGSAYLEGGWTFFELAAGSSTITSLATLPGQPGSAPFIADSQGNIFFTTLTGVMEWSPTAHALSTFASIYATFTGQNSSLTMDSSGDLLGFMGNYFFQIPAGTQTAQFDWVDYPTSSLVADDAGNFYFTKTYAGYFGIVLEKVEPAAPSNVTFYGPPSGPTPLGSPLPKFTAVVLDQSGQRMNADGEMTLDPLGGAIGGTLTASVVNGYAIFDNVIALQRGVYKLYATLSKSGSGSVSSFADTTITIYSDNPVRLSFPSLPPTPLAGVQFQLQVQELNELYEPASSSGDLITLTAPGGGLSGTLTATVSNGVATFSNLVFNNTGTFNLVATDSNSNLSPLTWSHLKIAPNVPTHLVFLQQTHDTTAGVAAPVRIAEEDSLGVIVPLNGDKISLTLAGGHSSGTIVATTVNGIAVFDNDTVYGAGTYTINASTSNTKVTGAASPSFNVIAGAPVKLYFRKPPQSVQIGNPFELDAYVGDTWGNPILTDTSTVTVSIRSGPAGASLSETTSLPMSNGEADFGDLQLSKLGGYTLVVTDGAFAPLISNPFAVTSDVAVLASFDGFNGDAPIGKLATDAQGNLYGATHGGGDYRSGTLFEIVKATGELRKLFTFNYLNAWEPFGGPIIDRAGNLYGALGYGGNGRGGGIYEWNRSTGQLAIIPLPGGSIAGLSDAGLVLDNAGNLYGTTYYGGPANLGTVFVVPHNHRSVQVLASFTTRTGAHPFGQLIIDSAGNLYGTTSGDNTSNGVGSVFKLAQGSHSLTVLATFRNPFPFGALVMDKQGNLFGTAVGINAHDSIFEITRDGKFSTLALFEEFNGLAPLGGLIIDGNGNLFGSAWSGGNFGDGAIFELPRGSYAIHAIASFSGDSNGQNPYGSLLFDGHKFFGVTQGGGPGGNGTVYSFTLPPPLIPQAFKVVITTQPKTAAAGTTLLQPLVVAVEGVNGKPIASGYYHVTVELASGPTGATFTPITVETISGVATFPGLSLGTIAGNYIFRASVWGLPATTSTTIVVSKPKVTHK